MTYPHGGAKTIFGIDGDGHNPHKTECGDWGAFVEGKITELDDKTTDFGQGFPAVRLDTNNPVSIQLAGQSIREHAIVWHSDKAKYYMMADVLSVSHPSHPNTYDSEIHLLSSTDLVTWTYHGVCIQKGTTGQIGQYGVATPAGAAFHNGKIYCPFSARNNAGFTGRSIGLAWSGPDPEIIPWTRAADAISDTTGPGEDDDPAVVSVDGTLHVYFRSSGTAERSGYFIAHAQSDTPEDASSWSAPVPCTVNPEPGVTAQELTAAVYFGGQVHLFVMEHQGAATGTAHLASADPAAADFAQYRTERFVPVTPGGMVYNGHFGIVMRGSEIKAFTWTVDVDGTQYAIELHRYEVPKPLVVSALAKGAILDAAADSWFKFQHAGVLALVGQFSLLFKCQLQGSLLADTDNYCLYYKGTDGNDAANEGTVAINLRGGSYNGLVVRFTKADGSYLTLSPASDISDKLVGEDAVIAVTRDGSGTARVYAIYDGEVHLISSGALSYADFAMSLTIDGAFGASYSGASSAAVPFEGLLSEAAVYNTALNEQQILDFAAESVAVEHRYTPAGTGEFAGCRAHYIFTGAVGERVPENSGRAFDAEYQGGVIPVSAPRKTDLGVHLERASNQSIPDAAYTEVVFDAAAIKEVGGAWDGTNLTIEVTGWYLVSMNARFAANATGTRGLRLYKNNAIAWSPANQDAVQASGQATIIDAATPMFLEKGDVLDMRVFQSSGGALDLQTANGTPFLKAVRIG